MEISLNCDFYVIWLFLMAAGVQGHELKAGGTYECL